jgi:uncharacterized membrane protein YccC
MSSRVLMLVVLALMAVILYAIGFKNSSYIFITVAAGLELWFWFKLFNSKEQNNHPK